jgi:hypothetical protein
VLPDMVQHILRVGKFFDVVGNPQPVQHDLGDLLVNGVIVYYKDRS